MDAKSILSNNLKAIRSIENLSLSSFATIHNIPKSTLQNIESGKSVTLDTVDDISKKLKIPVSALLSEDIPANQLAFITLLIKRTEWFSKLSSGDRVTAVNNIVELNQIMSDYDFEEV